MAAAADNKPTSLSSNTFLVTNRSFSLENEDVISVDSASAPMNIIDSQAGQVILSKKAIHQRDADENLFLRFLELDPPPDTLNNTAASSIPSSGVSSAPISSATNNTVNAGSARRTSTFPKLCTGRTPFTVTKRLCRTSERGFGFSIVWTHPPRVEKIEPGLSAAQSGILPGDYVIFVDKHNVVTMPEADILNLIRSQGNNLTLEIFRRQPSSGIPPLTLNSNRSVGLSGVVAATSGSVCDSNTMANGLNKSRVASIASTTDYSGSPALKYPRNLNLQSGLTTSGPRSSIACSNASLETTKRKLQLPQVTFSKESIGPVTDLRKRVLLQLISREQNFVGAIQFGMQRFVTPLQDRKDLISPNDHRTLFQNIDELMRISEDILEQLLNENNEQDPQMNFTSRVYISKTTAICAAYKKYCNGIKRADCVLVNKSRQSGSDFVSFITEPQVPRRRPDLTMLIHRPLQHFREILKLMQILASHCHVHSEEHKNFTSVINELQAAYREITVGGGLMEPLGEGRPLLTLQDLEARMVFTRCKPFTLAVQGRQWIFGGDLSRVEGRSVKPYWTLLFSDIIVFAKVSRDRVLFITEEPLSIANIVDSCFNIRKKNTEFRITVDPNGHSIESPTAYCAPDLTKTPKKNTRRKSLILRAPSLELKAVWQNLLQRQIFLVNAALGATPLSSPLDSPDVLNTLVPLSDIGAANTSIASIKLASLDSLNFKNQQQQQVRFSNALTTSTSIPQNTNNCNRELFNRGSYENLQKLASTLLSQNSNNYNIIKNKRLNFGNQNKQLLNQTYNNVNTNSIFYSLTTTNTSPISTITTATTTTFTAGIPNINTTISQSYNNSNNSYNNYISKSISPLPSAVGHHNVSHQSTQSLVLRSNTQTRNQNTCLTPKLNSCNNNNSSYYNSINNSLFSLASGLSNKIPLEVQSNSTKSLTAIPETINEIPKSLNNRNAQRKLTDSEKIDLANERGTYAEWIAANSTPLRSIQSIISNSTINNQRPLLEFSLSSVGRSFIDETEENYENNSTILSIATPETPTPNISPTSSNRCLSDTFSNDFVPSHSSYHHYCHRHFHTQHKSNFKIYPHHKNQTESKTVSNDKNNEKNEETDTYFTNSMKIDRMPLKTHGGSWDLLELDLEFHQLNMDPSFDTDVEEYVFLGDDDPFGVLPTRPTPPDSLDL